MATKFYRPIGLLDQLQRDMSSVIGASVSKNETQWSPAVDIVESEAGFTVYVDVPGVNLTEIEITADNGVLSIDGQRTGFAQDETIAFQRNERVNGKFLRRFTLPDNIDVDGITANYQDGVLRVSLPKSVRTQGRKIDIKAA
ncbi:Low molecular weight heat shock protein [Methylophaga frappieri]|uniref:Low molecular weight heat shock protein n=1 Tax=Methylophaga frappieri (strain ATCC BAA-2434 / DSM 25690 / JAM7) TaxID=754477 RepID=I1YEU1_METFJ|nr:Hsp20/alpha crystallin family protein [Methylophaga frappieri]AFJ01434.1 Low molecular weight heat shock protein [Methylophaga frappieri]